MAMANVGEPAATLSVGYLLVVPEHTMSIVAAINPQTRDPLIRLPYETWLQCLSLAIQDSADGPLPYPAVSPNWSETILSSPALWTQIIIDNGEDEEARLQTFLHLSSSQLLDVECAGNVPVPWLQLLAQYRMRIRSLVIRFSLYTTKPTELWSSLGSPKMRRLVFSFGGATDSIDPALISACPNLRTLENRSFVDESMIAATLEETSVWIQTLADLGSLFKCPRLRSLTVMRVILDSTPEPGVKNHFLQLSSHLGPHLVGLDIGLSLQEFIVFVPYIPSFLALYSAAFVLRMPDEKLPSRIATSIPKQGALNLRILSLQLYNYRDVYDLLTHRDTFGHILEYLGEHQILQDLHTFHCDSQTIHVEADRIASLLRCLSKARVLNLIFGGTATNITSIYAPIHMPNLLELSLSPIAWLARIEAPNLLRLSYGYQDNCGTPHLSEHFGSKISHLVVNETMSRAIDKAYSNGVGPKFESLRILRIADSTTVEWMFHLPSIRIIDFAYLPKSFPINYLLLNLLRHPEALPNLSKIQTRDNPCWELLFEVLRRRNTAQMHRIQELVLPGIPVFAILSRLVQLLQGYTDVCTNRDIDEVIYKRCNG